MSDRAARAKVYRQTDGARMARKIRNMQPQVKAVNKVKRAVKKNLNPMGHY